MYMHTYGKTSDPGVVLLHPMGITAEKLYEIVGRKLKGSSMMTGPMKCFCRMSGKRKFTDSDIAGMKKAEALNPADRNPYSWNMEYLPYEDGSGYEARFTACGICVLMKELGLFDLVPAMCRLDYTMSDAGGASEFIRRYTLASGGPYCDCGYKKKAKAASLKK